MMVACGNVSRWPGQLKTAGDEALCVPIQWGQVGVPPVFCVPGAGASVTAFIPLASALGSETPVYGLQPRGLDGKSEPFRDVLEAAQAYLPLIQRITAQGPRRLIGHSFGGWIAFEIARRLQCEGADVASPILVDSRPPSAEGVFRAECRGPDALAKLVGILEQSCGRSLRIGRDDFANLAEAERGPLLARAMASAGLISPRTHSSVVDAMARVFEANVNTRYLPESPLRGPATFVHASDPSSVVPHEDQEDSIKAWRHFIPSLTCAVILGNHMTMLAKPNVTALARIVQSQSQGRLYV